MDYIVQILICTDKKPMTNRVARLNDEHETVLEQESTLLKQFYIQSSLVTLLYSPLNSINNILNIFIRNSEYKIFF